MTKSKNNSAIQESLLIGFYNSFIFVVVLTSAISVFEGSTIAYKNAVVLSVGGIVAFVCYRYFYKKRKDTNKFLIAFLIPLTSRFGTMLP